MEREEMKRNCTSESLIWYRTTETDLLLLELAVSEVNRPPAPLFTTLPLDPCLETDLPLLWATLSPPPPPLPLRGVASSIRETERPRREESKSSTARSSRLISGNPDPLIVFTNLPLLLGAGVGSSSSSPTPGIRRENLLRLLARRWPEEERLEEEESPGELAREALLVVDLKAEVAIEKTRGREREWLNGGIY